VRKISLVVGLALLAALAVAGCGGGETPSPQSITIKAMDTFAFDPDTLTTKVGQIVELTLENTGVLEHTFVIDELDVLAGPVLGGQSAPISFIPGVAGTYTYYCSVPGHREAGMEGTFTVTE